MKFIAKLAVVFCTAAVVSFTAGTLVFGGGGSSSTSSADRTAYSAVYALKHKNFGRFCSYLAVEYRGPSVQRCADSNAAQWAQYAAFFGTDIFDPTSGILPDYRAEVDEDTVTYLVSFPALEANAYYRFTVELQESGKWRVSSIDPLPGLPTQSVGQYGSHAAVEG